MDLAHAKEIISTYIKEQFGRFLELREIVVVRSSTGRVWQGTLYCTTRSGEIAVGAVGVTESGRILGTFGADELIEALSRIRPTEELAPFPSARPSSEAPPPDDSFSELSEGQRFTLDDSEAADSDEIDGMLETVDEAALTARVAMLSTSTQRADLEEALELLPRLLSNPDERGHGLKKMGELELRLGEKAMALEYLEAAAKEFCDRADMEDLERVADIALQALGLEDFSSHTIKYMLTQARMRLRPVEQLIQVPAFCGLAPEIFAALESAAEQKVVRAGEIVLKEGEQAVIAFVIRSGIMSVLLEAPDGGMRLARSCFPGEFIGESSVLGGPGATYSATVRAERLTSMWCFGGDKLKQLARDLPDLKMRIESARALHRLDSFLSTHEATSSLGARVRDRLLGCIVAVRHVSPGEALGVAGQAPEAVYLVAEGEVEARREGAEPRVYLQDSFVGLRDTLHGLPLDCHLVATKPGRLIVFEANSMRQLAMESPADVVAVLDRL